MKKINILAAMLLSVVSLQAQSSFGITGGKLFNNFNISDEYYTSNSTKRSMSVGLFYEYNFGKRSQIYSNLTYDDRSTQTPSRLYRNNSAKQTTILEYLTLEAGYNLLLGKSKRFSVGAGIYYSRLQNSSIHIEGIESSNDFVNVFNHDKGLTVNIKYKITNRLSVLVKGTMGATSNMTYEQVYIPNSTFCATPYIANSKSVSYTNSSVIFGINYTL